MNRPRIPHSSGLTETRRAEQRLQISPLPSGHSCPPRYPHLDTDGSLGEPLSIGEVARLIGCSHWTIRQTLMPMGLPFFRSSASGKLIFYRDQVVRWIQQRQGGNT